MKMLGTLCLAAACGCAAGAAPAARSKITVGLMRGGEPEKWDLEANFRIFLDIAERAAAAKVDLLITPECWLDGYAAADRESTRDRLGREAAQRLDASEYLARVRREAVEKGMYILFGFTSLDGGRIRNSAGLWAPDGRLIGLYHKTHLQNHDLQFDPGPSLPVFPTPWGPLGVMICADRRWPEVARTLRLQGARLILNPSYGMRGDRNEVWMRTRGYENQCFIAFTHPLESLLVGPDGEVIRRVDGREPGLLVETIDLARAKDDNHIRDRRPELYEIITRR
ncbi:MAG: carbon-nitrogen hydrolase family protein [Planctomycetes bacterium]|nr:carbon-nitrogen hydrolase family protein [Planctomycetota bacterium]